MKDHSEEQLRLLLSHVDDLCRRAEGGAVENTSFLTMREQIEIDRHIGSSGRRTTVFWGGYEGSERKMLFCLPEYISDSVGLPIRELQHEELAPWLRETWEECMSVLRVKGSGYKELDHRSYLGSLLSMGIEREVLGDIVVQSPHEALVVCERRIADYLLSEWHTVGADTVKVSSTVLPDDFRVERKYQEIRDTVASDRLDCVLAALTNLSREKAQGMIRAGLVDVDFITEQRTDRSVPSGAMLSVRGYGRFELVGMDGVTRKGRLRLVAKKFI